MEINYNEVYCSKAGDNVKNKFGEKWIKIDSGEPYEIAQKAVPENKNRLRLYDLVKVDGDGLYYIAFYVGGLNGCGKWSSYLKDINKLIENISGSWVIDLNNDCCDDVFNLAVGFRVTNS